MIEETLTTFLISALKKGMTMMAPLWEDVVSKTLNLRTNLDILVHKIGLLKKVIAMSRAVNESCCVKFGSC